MKPIHYILAITFFLITSECVHAYKVITCNGKAIKWNLPNNATLDFGASPTSFPVGSTWYTGLNEAKKEFNKNPSQMRLGLNTDSKIGFGNEENDIWASTPENVPQLIDEEGHERSAVAGLRATCFEWGDIKIAQWRETNIIFNSNTLFTPSNNKREMTGYGGENAPMREIAMHEFGHAIGLDHVEKYSLMHPGAIYLHTNGDNANAYVGEDTAAGLMALYGLRYPVRKDVSVSHWKFREGSGGIGGYRPSSHVKTIISNSAGNLVRSFWCLRDRQDNQ